MYSITPDGILKKLETWSLTIPLHDNSSRKFSKEKIDGFLENISNNFSGFSIVNCIGVWKGQTQTFTDENIQIIVDTMPTTDSESSTFFSRVKDDLARELDQENLHNKNQQQGRTTIFCRVFY